MKFEKVVSFFSNSKELVMPDLFYGWLILAFIFLIMEMGNPGLFLFLSFFFGGLCAAGMSYFSFSVFVQILSFFGGIIISLYILRHWGLSLLAKNRSHQQTNFYALKGKRAVVTQDLLGDRPGLVTIGGQIWAARTIYHDNIICIGEIVEVVDVRGAHVIVKRI